ncbi:DUF5592 family protein [Listeria aquatica]|uniref:RDD domain-containing protein n=1 Tax=Listeria aquatica FSL S10-1188 TaxID=1265818 RepID=W7ATR4_9LIST|nr:DUF5592 family protein [Listeria aquatica]EUJ16590.1 hypothetical protein MAQA_15676 [Listeria aquatica FSL S10-1188]
MYQIPKSTKTEVKLFLGLFFIDIAIIGGGIFFGFQTMKFVAGWWQILYMLAIFSFCIFMITRFNGHRMYRVIFQALKKDNQKYYAVMDGDE